MQVEVGWVEQVPPFYGSMWDEDGVLISSLADGWSEWDWMHFPLVFEAIHLCVELCETSFPFFASVDVVAAVARAVLQRQC
jgi:hypothetical protein|tara:strand:- start:156 stop:398 length:243 start_codon:yes stop_codon:yes gene_type:complete